MTRRLEVLEGPFQGRLEIALNAPERATRVQRINSGEVLVVRQGGGKYLFRGAKEGTGDLVGFDNPGLYLEVEAKAFGRTQRPAQKRRQAALRRAGCAYVKVEGPETTDGMDEAIARALREVDAEIARVRGKRRT